MKLAFRHSFVLITLLTFSKAALADWGAPIQCALKTVVGESGPKIEALSGMTEASHTKKIESALVNKDGEITKEMFNYEINVRLTSTNLYTLHIKDLDQNSTVSTKAFVPNGGTIESEIILIKDYPVVNGMGVLFPRFKISLQCQLRSQSTSSIPDLTPGPPPQQ